VSAQHLRHLSVKVLRPAKLGISAGHPYIVASGHRRSRLGLPFWQGRHFRLEQWRL